MGKHVFGPMLHFLKLNINSSRTTYAAGPNGTTSKWLAGLNPKDFPGPTLGEQLVQAAHSMGAHILSVRHGMRSSIPIPASNTILLFVCNQMLSHRPPIPLTLLSPGMLPSRRRRWLMRRISSEWKLNRGQWTR